MNSYSHDFILRPNILIDDVKYGNSTFVRIVSKALIPRPYMIIDGVNHANSTAR